MRGGKGEEEEEEEAAFLNWQILAKHLTTHLHARH